MKKLLASLAVVLLLCAAAALTVAPVSTGQGQKSKVKKKERPVLSRRNSYGPTKDYRRERASMAVPFEL